MISSSLLLLEILLRFKHINHHVKPYCCVSTTAQIGEYRVSLLMWCNKQIKNDSDFVSIFYAGKHQHI